MIDPPIRPVDRKSGPGRPRRTDFALFHVETAGRPDRLAPLVDDPDVRPALQGQRLSPMTGLVFREPPDGEHGGISISNCEGHALSKLYTNVADQGSTGWSLPVTPPQQTSRPFRSNFIN